MKLYKIKYSITQSMCMRCAMLITPSKCYNNLVRHMCVYAYEHIHIAIRRNHSCTHMHIFVGTCHRKTHTHSYIHTHTHIHPNTRHQRSIRAMSLKWGGAEMCARENLCHSWLQHIHNNVISSQYL